MSTTLLAAALLFALPSVAGRGPVAAVATAARTVTVEGDRITLGDISPTLPRAMLAVDLGPSPAPGAHTQITRAAVADALRRHGADPSLATGLPVRQDVRRAAAVLEVDDLDIEVRAAVLAELPLGVDIDAILGLRAVTLPPGEHRVAVKLGRLRRSTRATVEVTVGERRWASMSTTLQLSGTAKTPVLHDTMAPGATVTARDVGMREVEIDDLPQGAITRTDQLVGQRLRVRSGADAPLRRTSTETTPIVTRGSIIHVTMVRPGLRITRQAVAQQDGRPGDDIRVKPTDDGRVLVVRVDANGEAHMVSAGGGR